jgi:hypothetical protein
MECACDFGATETNATTESMQEPSMFPAHRVLLAGLLAICSITCLPSDSSAQDRSWLAAEPSKLEQQVQRAMAGPVSLSFHDAPLEEVIERVKEKSGLQIVLDRKALADAGLGSDAPLALDISGISLRAALRLILDAMDLCWVIQDEVVLITTKVEAENMLATKIYDVVDLVEGARCKSADFKPLLELITSTIAPTTWDEVGGPAAITSLEMPDIRAVVVSQTEEVHYDISVLLKTLRRLKSPEVDSAVKAMKSRRTAPSRTYVTPPAWAVPHVHE